MPTPSWTVSFTMPTASNSPAKACAVLEANRTRRLDQPPSPMTQIHRPARLATRAASFRYGGRHHSGIPGDIIPLYPGDFVGIRNERDEEVRLIDSTCEASEQSGAIHCGVGGGKRWDQEECGTAKHGPDAESGSRVTSAGPHTRSCNQEREGETDSAPASHQHQRPAVGLL